MVVSCYKTKSLVLVFLVLLWCLVCNVEGTRKLTFAGGLSSGSGGLSLPGGGGGLGSAPALVGGVSSGASPSNPAAHIFPPSSGGKVRLESIFPRDTTPFPGQSPPASPTPSTSPTPPSPPGGGNDPGAADDPAVVVDPTVVDPPPTVVDPPPTFDPLPVFDPPVIVDPPPTVDPPPAADPPPVDDPPPAGGGGNDEASVVGVNTNIPEEQRRETMLRNNVLDGDIAAAAEAIVALDIVTGGFGLRVNNEAERPITTENRNEDPDVIAYKALATAALQINNANKTANAVALSFMNSCTCDPFVSEEYAAIIDRFFLAFSDQGALRRAINTNVTEVARLYAKNNQCEIEDKPFAELWMGTHPNGHSTLADSGTTLEKWIEANPQALGSIVLDKFGVKLPFLFKVLSVQNALSIQSHPDKELAKKLHFDNPKVYKDPNHKPEMAIAISTFEALCGFESFEDILRSLDAYPELQTCVGGDSIHAMKHATPTTQKQALESLFTNLMTCQEDVYGQAIDSMLARIKTKADKTISAKDELLLTLNKQYPRDIGILAACLLNYVCLNEGEALYLAANEPHAYIAGEIVECMATSDNVIRAGLTPKLRDTSILCKSLTYNMGSLALMEGERIGDCAMRYSPPFEEFEVLKIDISANATHVLDKDQGPSLLLVYEGEAIIHQKTTESSLPDIECNVGDVFFVPNTITLEINMKPSIEKCILWQAKVNHALFA